MAPIIYRQEMRRCGNPACTRCREKPSHGPYWYAYERDERGHLCSRYCGKTRPTGTTQETPPPSLRIRLLGDYTVERDGILIEKRHWQRASARMLLALLLVHPTGLTREQASAALWPDKDGTASTQALKTALSTLRRVLEPPHRLSKSRRSKAHRLPPHDTVLRLHLTDGDWVDAHELLAATDPQRLTVAALTDLVALYRGDLLPEFRDREWTFSARETVRTRWHALSLHQAHRLVTQNQEKLAVAHLQAVLADDSTQEDAARLLMTVLAAQGKRDAALRVYRQLSAALDSELAVAPDDVSRALAERLRQGNDATRPLRPSSHQAAERLRSQIARLAVPHPVGEAVRRQASLWADYALVLGTVGDVEGSLVSVQSGHLLIDGQDYPAERARLLLAQATIYDRQGRAHAAAGATREAEQLAVRAGDRRLEVWARRLLARTLGTSGALEAALAQARSSAALSDAMGAGDQALHSRAIIALTLWRMGHFAASIMVYERNLTEARMSGNHAQQMHNLIGLGAALAMQGDLEAAETHLVAALDPAARLDDQYLVLTAEYHLANLWADLAFLATEDKTKKIDTQREAQARFKRAIRLAQAQQSRHMIVYVAADLAVALAQWGEAQEARRWLALAQQTLQQCPDNMGARGWAALSAAEVALAERDAEAALTHVTEAIPLLAQSSPAGLSQAHRVAALAHATRREILLATSEWEVSLKEAVRHGQAVEEARTRRVHERVLHQWR